MFLIFYVGADAGDVRRGRRLGCVRSHDVSCDAPLVCQVLTYHHPFLRDGDRLNRGGNTVKQETASLTASLSSLP